MDLPLVSTSRTASRFNSCVYVFCHDPGSPSGRVYPKLSLFHKSGGTSDTETLRHRILTRTDHDFGKDPQELQNTLERHAQLQEELLAAPGAMAIDGQRSLDSVVGDIVSAIQLG